MVSLFCVMRNCRTRHNLSQFIQQKRDRCTKIVRPSRLWSERMMFRFDDDYSPSRNFASATTSAALKLPS